MGRSRFLRISAAASIAAAAIGICAGGLYALRRPIVVVTDEAFQELYGVDRAEGRRKAASLKLFRRIAIATVAPTAAPVAAAEAAASAAERPYCVVFPSRYAEGAAAFARSFADVPSVVVGGEGGPNVPATPLRFGADTVTDLYRAGRMAGLLSEGGGRPLLLAPSAGSIAVFSSGLSDAGYIGEPLVLRPGAPLPSGGAFSCVVAADGLRGSAASELQDAPLLLFSWIDTELAPPRTVAVFDDSVWALLVPAVRSAVGGKSGSAPSRVWFTVSSETKAARRLRAAALARYSSHNSL